MMSRNQEYVQAALIWALIGSLACLFLGAVPAFALIMAGVTAGKAYMAGYWIAFFGLQAMVWNMEGRP